MDFAGPELLALLALTGFAAGFVDSIAGGGGLITMPALLWAGLTPAAALATNKLQSSFGSFSASLNYMRKGMVDLGSLKGAIVLTFAGSVAGTLAVRRIDAAALSRLLPILLVGIALYFLFSPKAGAVDRKQRLSVAGFALLIGTGVGFYDGFFGPGTGSFFTIAFVTLLGFNLAKATAHTKILNFTSNVASLLTFALAGDVVWKVGLVMAAGQFAGARLGSSLVVAKGPRLVRPILVGVSILISIKLLADDPNGLVQSAREFLAALWA